MSLMLAGSSSEILSQSMGMVHAFAVHEGRGAFSKENQESRRAGRRLCDLVRREFDCAGFFTTDELPRYGLTEEDRNTLFRLYRKASADRDVLVLTTYNRGLSERIRDFLLDELELRTVT